MLLIVTNPHVICRIVLQNAIAIHSLTVPKMPLIQARTNCNPVDLRSVFTFLSIRRWAFDTIYYHSLEGDTATALRDRANYMICAHSPDGDTAAALVEFPLSEHILLIGWLWTYG